MYAENFAKLCDLIYVYQNHYNFVNGEKEEKEELIMLEKNSIEETFLPYFYCYNEVSLIEELLFCDTDDINKVSDIICFLEMSLDYRVLINKMIRYYSIDTKKQFSCESISSLREITEKIMETQLPSDIKNGLITFFLDPVLQTKKLISSMMVMILQIENIYKNKKQSIYIARDLIDSDAIQKIVENDLNQKYDEKDNIFFSIGVLQQNSIKVWGNKNCKLMYIGENYREGVHQKESIDMELFGKLFSESIRIRILDLILKREKVTSTDVNKQFDLSGTTAYYHLSMMLKAGMLKITRAQGKYLYYSIDSNYFNSVILDLKKYINQKML